ncbi:MAG: SDR family NAD(P)-dependent oxidoreductase [Frankia sp.]
MIDIVASMTGYPAAMVDPTLDLEMDLGVDSIKRVQVLSAMRERVPSLPTVSPEQLGELRTVDQITAFLTEAGPTAPAPTPAPVPAPVPAAAVANGGAAPTADLRSVMIDIVASMTGYPAAMVDPTLDLEMDLGVDSIKRVQVLSAMRERVPSLPTVSPEQLGELRTVDQITTFLTEAGDVDPKARSAGAFSPRHTVELAGLPSVDVVENLYRQNPIAVLVDDGHGDGDALADGLVERGWTVHRAPYGADLEQRISAGIGAGIDLCLTLVHADDWENAQRRLTETIMLGKWATAALDPARGRAAFVTLTRLDGGNGLHGRRGAVSSLVGGVSGVVKTLAEERAGLFCRAVDIDPALPRPAFVAAVVDEIRDAAIDTLEVGVDATGRRWTVVPGKHGPARVVSTVDPQSAADPVTVTGEDLLVVTGGARGVTALCVRALADHTPARFLLLGRTALAAEPDWAAGVADADLKAAAIAGWSDSGTPASPRAISRACGDVIAQREIRETVAALGGRGEYLAVDVTDPAAVQAELSGYRDTITGLVHGAGVLADAMLADKTVAQVETVFRPKLDGLRNVLDALDGEALRHLVMFTSVAGLLGNPGQADYAAANEALCRFAAGWKYTHPDAHVTAIDWSAWNGGMVTPQLRELFTARGIPLLDPAVGARAFVDQFTEARSGELRVLVGDSKALGEPQRTASPAFVTRRDFDALVAEPVIQAHRVGAHPVLPATFALGCLINVVERANPGLSVVEVAQFQVHKGVVFDPATTAGADYRVDVEAGVLDGDRMRIRATIGSENASGRSIPRFSGTFTLAPQPPAASRIEVPPVPAGSGNALDLYREAIAFHGPALQGMRTVLERSPSRVVVSCQLPDTEVATGAYAGRLHSPVLADVLLHGMLVLSDELLGAPSLPLGIGRADLYAPLPDDEPFIVIVDNARQATGLATMTATATTLDGQVLQRFTDVPMVSTNDLADKFRESVRQWRDADRQEAIA